jgi:integrase/recombinase XerD
VADVVGLGHDRRHVVGDHHLEHPEDMPVKLGPVINSRPHMRGRVREGGSGMDWSWCLTRSTVEGELRGVSLGHPQLDDYLAFVAARGRANTLLATAWDLKVFFGVVAKEPAAVTTADVFAFIKRQREPRRGGKVVRLEDGEAGLAARTIKRRLSSVSGLFSYLLARGDAGVTVNPVPRGLATRQANVRPGSRGVPLLRTPRTLPRVLAPAEVGALIDGLRTSRDRAMVEAMVLGALRRCEVLGLRLADLHPGERRVFVAQGKGGHQRLVPISPRFFTTLASYLTDERPESDREAVQAQAGHRSIESTRVYLHLASDWLTGEYARAIEALEAEAMGGPA